MQAKTDATCQIRSIVKTLELHFKHIIEYYFVLTYFKQEHKCESNYCTDSLNFVWDKQPQNLTLFTKQLRSFCQSKKTQEIKFLFSALLFPKAVVKVVSCTDIAIRVQNMYI